MGAGCRTAPRDSGCAVRQQPGRPGVVPPDLAEDDGDVARGGSRHRPQRVRHLPVPPPERHERSAVRRARGLSVDAEQAGVLPRLHRQLEEAVAVERRQAEPARADRRRTRPRRATLHTIATGLDYVVTNTLFRRPDSRISTRGVPSAQSGRADVEGARREDVQLHRDDPRPGLPRRRAVGRRLDRTLLRVDALHHAGLRLDARARTTSPSAVPGPVRTRTATARSDRAAR